jgi:hypothetical protein
LAEDKTAAGWFSQSGGGFMRRVRRTDENILAAALLTWLFFATGCGPASFDDRFQKVQTGQTRDDVLGVLGVADASATATVPSPGFGPRQGLRDLLGPADTFEEWKYTRDGNDYYVWFGSTKGASKKQWQVLRKSSIPVGAVF